MVFANSYMYGGQHVSVRYAATPATSPYHLKPADGDLIPFACTRKGGRIKFPDGAQLFPGQCIIRPDGTTVFPNADGSMIVDQQGTILLPDMSIIFSDSSRIYPSGQIDQGTRTTTAVAGTRNMPNALQGVYDVPVGALKFADGTFKFPNGVTSYPDGSLRLPEGSMMLPSGQLVYPDGTHALELRDGSYRLTDGTLFLPDGSMKFRDGTIQRPDGHYDSPELPPKSNPHQAAILLANNAIQMPDGSVQLPDGSVQLTDKEVMHPDGNFAVPDLNDGSYTLFDGTRLMSDGAIRQVDGRYVYPNGMVRAPDGRTISGPTKGSHREGREAIPEGSVYLHEEGSWQFPNGICWARNESIICPDGSVRSVDDLLTRPDGTVVGPNIDGEFLLTDGTYLLNDNSLRQLDGVVKRPNGTVVLPDGTEQLPDGSIRHPDGTMRLSNGNVILPDYSIQFPNGLVRLPNGASRGAHGTLAGRPPRLEDPRRGDPIVEWLRMPDGSLQLPNGMIQYPDGNVKLPEGSIKLPDGRVKLPNDSYSPLLQDGTHRLSDGSQLLPDGSIKYRNGHILQLDGSTRCADGSVVGADGRTYPPGWPAPRLLSPIFSGPKVPPGSQLLPDGSYRLPNQMVQHPDGTVQLPDGSTRRPNGDVVLPNGQPAQRSHDGGYWLANDTLLLADGSLRYPDNSVEFPDGAIQLPNGEIHTAQGSVLPPGATVPRCVIPGFAQDLRPLTPGQMPALPRGSIKLRDGAYKLPNGMVYYPDGRLGLPDGSIKHADGRVQMPDGKFVLANADGSLTLLDGSRLLADGTILYSNGRIKYPDGSVKEAPKGALQPVPAAGQEGVAQQAATPAADKKKKSFCGKLCACSCCSCFPCCKKDKPQPSKPAAAQSGQTPTTAEKTFANGIVQLANDQGYRLPDGSRMTKDFVVTSPSGAAVSEINGEWQLTDRTKVTRDLGIKYVNGVTKLQDGSVKCPEGSLRQAPPKDTKMNTSRGVVENSRRLFDLTDGTQLLPNLGIRGRDNIIHNIDGTKERVTVGADFDSIGDDRGGRNNKCLVQHVQPDGPFAQAGIQANDIVDTWNNQPLDGKPGLISQLEKAIPREAAFVMITRNQQSMGPMRVDIGSTNQLVLNQSPVPAPFPAPMAPSDNMRPWFGAQIKFVDELATGKRDNLVQIHSVDANSPAEKAGLLPQDIVRYWDGQLIEGEQLWKGFIRSATIGQRVRLGVIRDERNMEMTVVIEGTSREKSGKTTVGRNSAA